MKNLIRNETGSALVTTLFFLLGLAVTGAIIAGIASSEKRVTYNEYTHTRALHSSDAGSEEAINWVRNITGPSAVIVAPATKVLDQQNFSDLTAQYATGENNQYRYDVTYDGRDYRPGWPPEYKDYRFTIDSEGASSQESEAVLEVQADRLLRDAGNKY
jgi:Tfp pilus assembly protein PilX